MNISNLASNYKIQIYCIMKNNMSMYRILGFIILSFVSYQTFAQFDDVYYDPKKDGVDYNQRSVVKTVQTDNNNYSDDGYYDDDEYDYYDNEDDYTYTRRIQRFHRPNAGFNYFDPFYNDVVFYDPFWSWNSPSYMYNDWGWRRRFAPYYYNRPNFWMGAGYNSFTFISIGGGGWNDPYYSPWNSYGYNNYGYNNWGCNNYGWGNNYHNGYYGGHNNYMAYDNYKPKHYGARRGGAVTASDNGAIIHRGVSGSDGRTNTNGIDRNQPRNAREKEYDNNVRNVENPRTPRPKPEVRNPRTVEVDKGNTRNGNNAVDSEEGPRHTGRTPVIQERRPVNVFGGRKNNDVQYERDNRADRSPRNSNSERSIRLDRPVRTERNSNTSRSESSWQRSDNNNSDRSNNSSHQKSDSPRSGGRRF